VFVCNTATQPGETDGYSVLDHVTAIEQHTWPGLFPLVLANANRQGTLLPQLTWVRTDAPVNGQRRLILADLSDDQRPWRHSSEKLAARLVGLLQAGQPPPGPDTLSTSL
jgi:hypothetical protein